MGILGLSLRYLRTRRIALVAVFSIAVGVLAMIVVVSLMDGVLAFLRDHLKGTQADLVIQHVSSIRDHFDAVRGELEAEMVPAGGPIVALAPRAVAKALIVPGDRPGPEQQDLVQGVQLLGIDWALEREVLPIERMIGAVEGEDLRVPAALRAMPLVPDDPPPVLLGDSLARALGVTGRGGPGGGDLVTIIAGRPTTENGQPSFNQAKSRTFRVVGCFTTGREDFDGAHVCMDRGELLRLRSDRPELEADCLTVHARLADPTAVRSVLSELQARHPALILETWETTSRNELLALQDQKRIMVVILAFIVAIAAVAISGIVYLMVVEKTRDIGILRSMGLGRARMVGVFTVYGFLLGVAGCVAGVVAGVQVTSNLDRIVAWLSDVTGVQLLDPRIYRFKSVPTKVEAGSVALIALSALGMSLVASVLPALRAALMSPVRCLRSE